MVTITFTDEEAKALVDAAEVYAEEYDNATNDVMHDRFLSTPEMLLEAIDGMHEGFDAITSALNKLRSATKEMV